MDETLTVHWESLPAHEDGWTTEPRNRMDDVISNHSGPGRSLPCRADRQKIMEQANLVLAEARLVAEQSDRTLALLQ